MKKIVAYFDRMEEIHLYKDVGMVPYYLAKKLDIKLEYLTASKNIRKSFRGSDVKRIKRFYNYKYNVFFYLWLLKNAKEIDLLCNTHIRSYNLLIGLAYKICNPKGIYYLKADQDLVANETRKAITDYKTSTFSIYKIMSKLYYKVFFKLLRYVDIMSFEQKDTFEHVKEFGICGFNVSEKIILTNNGFDDFYKIDVISAEQKSNIMITSGRIGDYGKNNEFFIEVLKKINIKDWQIYFIGPVEKEFHDFIEELPCKYEEIKNRIHFLGDIRNREKLYDLYRQSKIFFFTSRKEGYPLVFPEASYYGNYIITTDVGGGESITDNSRYGKVIEQGDLEGYARHLQYLIDNPEYLNGKIKDILDRREQLTWNNIINQNIAVFKKQLKKKEDRK